jgi:MFS family permease
MGGPALSSLELRRALRLSLVDGLAFAFMVGVGETYLLADAVRLSASTLELGLVVTLPLFLGAIGPLLVLRLLGRVRSRRRVVVCAVSLQALNWAALAAGDLSGLLTARGLIAFACVHQVCGQASGTAWSSWIGDLVPRTIRGRFFGRRNRGIYLATCAGLLAGGALLQLLEPGPTGTFATHGGRGFAVLYALAAGARVLSAWLLARTPEPPFAGLPDRVRVLRFLRTERGTRAWRIVLFSGTLYLSVYVASPYFTPFMLEDLAFSYAEFMLASVSIVALKVLFVPAWGRVVDQHGARPTFALAALLTSLVPLPWLWARGLGWVLVAQGFSGLAWAGYEVSLFALLLDSSYRGTRPHVFAVQSVLNGAAQLLGGLLGALAILWLADLRVVFALSLATRLALALVAPGILPSGPGAERTARRDIFLRVMGIRPSGGITHRPILEADEPPGAADTSER